MFASAPTWVGILPTTEIAFRQEGEDHPIAAFKDLFWFEPNPEKPYVACITSNELLIVNAFTKATVRKRGATSICGLRWKSGTTLMFAIHQRDEDFLIYSWAPLRDEEPRQVAKVANYAEVAEGLRKPWKPTLERDFPSDRDYSWDLSMQGTFPILAKRLAFENAEGGLQASDSGLQIFHAGTKSWQSLLPISESRFGMMRPFGAILSATFIENPNKALWTVVGGMRTKLTDPYERYTTYIVNSNGALTTLRDIAYAVPVNWPPFATK